MGDIFSNDGPFEGADLLSEEFGELQIKRIKKILHGFLSFITHIWNPEGFPFDLSVTSIDGKAMLYNDWFDPAGLVKILWCDEAG